MHHIVAGLLITASNWTTMNKGYWDYNDGDHGDAPYQM
jgi:hypothetical protein